MRVNSGAIDEVLRCWIFLADRCGFSTPFGTHTEYLLR